ncbi:SLAP domain-containing protein [Companilactobacillus musae]|uniref:SLAP domain-containing protein n=1 Tax=Companilactobacillus musae TaxID=1903258 RepID=UPI000E652F5C|nr:SLAP domain-containing protein [Companilactobacillus musae]
MRRKVIVAIFAIVLGIGFSFLPTETVKAESVTSGYYVDVSSSSAKVYNVDGEYLDKTESENSDWYLGRTIDIKGTDYYQIATNEYLSSNDSYVYRDRPEVIRVDTDGDIPVFNHKFVESSEVALAPGTYWYSDRVITTPDGMPFVRVATDEYVGMWYVIQQSFTSRI